MVLSEIHFVCRGAIKTGKACAIKVGKSDVSLFFRDVGFMIGMEIGSHPCTIRHAGNAGSLLTQFRSRNNEDASAPG